MSDSAGEGKREGLVGRAWLGCWVAAFAVTAVLFWLPWGDWLELVDGAQVAETMATLFVKGCMLVMWPLNWLASTVGYAMTGAVGVGLMTLGLWKLRDNDNGWKANTMCLSIFYGVVAVVYGISGIHVQAAERALDFARAPTPNGIFKVLDGLSPTQVQAIRKGLDAGASRKLLFEQVTQTAGVDGPYKNTFFYTPSFYQSMFGNSFMALFYGEDLGIKSGLVCEKIRQNYLKSAVTDRYQLSINGVVVSASSGSCRSLFLNKVVLSYRGAFAAP